MLAKVVETRVKYVDTAVICLLDFARGAIRAQDGETPMYAVDIAHDLKASPISHRSIPIQFLTAWFLSLVPEVPDNIPEPETILGIRRGNRRRHHLGYTRGDLQIYPGGREYPDLPDVLGSVPVLCCEDVCS